MEVLTLEPSSTTVSRSLPFDSHEIIIFAEGTTEYTDCNGLLFTSSDVWPQSALFQIAASGIPTSKLVIGKPATGSDAANGFVPTSTLAQCVQQAKSQGWSECDQFAISLSPG